KNREVDDQDNAQPEQECVGLQIAYLNQSGQRARTPGGRARSPNGNRINDPAIDESSESRECFLGGLNQPAIELVDIKSSSQKRNIKAFALAAPINEEPPRGSGEQRSNREYGHNHVGFRFLRQW